MADTQAALASLFLQDERPEEAIEAMRIRHAIFESLPYVEYSKLRESRSQFAKALQNLAPKYWQRQRFETELIEALKAGPRSLPKALVLAEALEHAPEESFEKRRLFERLQSMGPPTLGAPRGHLARALELLAVRASWTGLDGASQRALTLAKDAPHSDAWSALDQLEVLETELREQNSLAEAEAVALAHRQLQDRLSHLTEVLTMPPHRTNT